MMLFFSVMDDNEDKTGEQVQRHCETFPGNHWLRLPVVERISKSDFLVSHAIIPLEFF